MENFSQWYHNILEEASIIDSRYPIKGMSVWLPKGFKLRKHIIEPLKKLLDKDHEEVLFPLLVPEDELAKEGIHVKGFEDEVYWVTHGGQKELNKKLAIRPTSETAMYPMFSLWVRSHIDLPMKFYQVVNTFRYETKHTRPLIRVREITTFKEAHTVHTTKEGADEQVKEAIKIYKEFFDTLAIPYLLSKRPIWDKFPGADYTMAFDTLMPDGKTLQIGTVHNLGQTFAKTFDITYETAESTHDYVYQTCYGLSDRVIASVIGIHGDEKGLRLPPQIAPNQVTIIPIIFKKGGEEVLNKCEEIKSSLESNNIRTSMDTRDIRPGKKFYEWELNGSPIRIELGPRDLENNKAVIVRRDNLEKVEIDLESDYVSKIEEMFKEISENMKNQVWKKMNDSIISTKSLDNVNELIKDEKVVSFTWCGNEECGKVIEEITEIDILGTQSENSDYCKDIDGSKCIHCGKEGKYTALMAKTY
ncbi:proline--tRNA ligase [Methanobrevibacter arboriphilus]|jgi:prolyl-tRNA synthetase|uniref:Proline--tRNA ligase n=1 Tax=Methanobrevibacter arboriphilus TaxID=39441 RepID=A0ACA8R1Q2_METAZ|nr:proline--tRNA ligase [Methanobrevibacter arboriphilus]BBL61461.1 proline--tRNA ligase [Methanobrevibacter arboriphilus]GLI11208.1 proline--tRNA ligase [Methanobrevibacter arboriphilus]